jgi:hypothetical protein
VLHSSALRQVVREIKQHKIYSKLKFVIPYCNSNDYDIGLNDNTLHCLEIRLGSSVSIVSRLYVWQRLAIWGLIYRKTRDFFFITVSRLALGPSNYWELFPWVSSDRKGKARSEVGPLTPLHAG